jgi:hypothetical protein
VVDVNRGGRWVADVTPVFWFLLITFISALIMHQATELIKF